MSIRLTGILILLLALVAGLIFYLRATQPETKKEERPEIWDVDEKKINRLEIRLAREKKQIAFFLDKDNDKWVFDDYRKTPLDKKRWGGIIFLLSNPKGKRKIADNAEDLDRYGLGNPQTIITLGLDNVAKPFEILIGDPTPQKDQFYVKLGHSPPIYLVNNTFVEVINRLVNEPPIHPLTKAKDEELSKKKSKTESKD
jgi:hypothetical protein